MIEAQAEEIAVQALAWLCADPDHLGAFLGQSGASPDDLRAALHTGPDQGLLGSVLDFILQADRSVLDCARALNLPPDRLQMAAAILSGRAQMHWT
ncbi:MAG: DUF3572 domain-containing protein [Roseinatronobacter sp.]